MSLWKAFKFAQRAHGDQKYGDNLPYTHHLLAVCRVAKKYLDSPYPEFLQACLLHDVVEDTSVTIEDVEREFGTKVSFLVHFVTNKPGKNRAERHARTYPFIAHNEHATALKLCDRLANVQEGGKKIEMYRKEYREFRRVLYLGLPQHKRLWKALDEILA